MNEMYPLCIVLKILFAFTYNFPICMTEGGQCFEQHRSIQKLTSMLDLKHTCGFITLLKTGKKYVPVPNGPIQNTNTSKGVTSPSIAKFSKDNLNSAAASHISVRSQSCSPKNGIHDSVSAEMLASELDSLDEVLHGQPMDGESISQMPGSPDRSKLTLEFSDKSMPQVEISDCDNTLECEWVLLDCCYGIPLFHASVNKQVCQRIAAKGLCNRER